MRIISKWHDYYDSVMSHGIDTTKIFKREESSFPGFFPLKYNNKRNSHLNIGDADNWSEPFIGSFGIFFAGKYYPGFEVRTNHLNEVQRFYTLDSFARYIHKMELTYMLFKDSRPWEKNTKIETIKSIFQKSGSDDLRVWGAENKIAIATDWGIQLGSRHRANLITVNPCLRDLQFQKLVDPMTAYQELDQWISGVLTEPDPPNPVPDIQKVVNHGFDPKLSFRKGKEK